VIALPISGAAIVLRNPDGIDDMLLADASGGHVEIAIALLERLYGEVLDVPGLVVTDFESLLLQVRCARFGSEMALAFACPHCRELAEVSFPIADCLSAAKPRHVPGVVPHPSRPGWFAMAEAGFRLPTAGDQARVAGQPNAATGLSALCLDETAAKPSHRARVERAMETMAPTLSRAIAGTCPSCREKVKPGLAIAQVVVSEIKRAAGAVYDEVDLIASAYHWPEPLILSLSPQRRRAYVERIRRRQVN